MESKGISSAGFNLSVLQKIAVVLMGGLLLGGMWRLRGDNGFGSFWGMLPCSLVFWLFLLSIFGYRKKMSYDILPWAVLSVPFTINAWMPLMPLLRGFIEAPGPQGAGVNESFSYLSAVFLIFCLGFCWMTFLGFFLGLLFSPKRYKAPDFLLVVGIYLAVMLAMKGSLAHGVMRLAAPQSWDVFDRDLLEKGVTDSPFVFYMKNIFHESAQKQFIGGRTYFNGVAAIGNALGGIAVLAALLIKYKDKTAARIMASVCSIVGGAFLGAALLNVMYSNGFRGAEYDARAALPEWMMNNYWGFVEYATGLFIGLGVTAFLVFQRKKVLNAHIEVTEDLPPSSKNKYWCYAYHLFVTAAFMLSTGAVRPIATRIRDGSGGEVSETLVQIIVAVALASFFIPGLWRTIVKKELGQPFAPDLRRFAIAAAPLMLAVFSFIDLFIGWPFWNAPVNWPLQLQVGGSCALVLLGYQLLVSLRVLRLE